MLGSVWAWLRTLAIALAVCLAATPSAAQGGGLVLEASPLLGSGVPAGGAWFTVAVRVHNTSDSQIEGNLELTSELPWTGDARVVTRAPFAVAGKARVTVELPTHGFLHSPPMLRVRAVDGAGEQLTSAELPDPRSREPLLFDLSVPPRIGSGLRGQHVSVHNTSKLRGSYGAPLLSVSNAQVNAATGEPILPNRAAGYAPVTVMLAKSEQLARLSGSELDALGSWVLGGGSLAIVVSRPEDLRGAVLTAFVGAKVEKGAPAAGLSKQRSFEVAPDPGSSGSAPYGYPGSGGTTIERKAPGESVVATLTGYRGGNLHDSPWGASASYGLGEVHLLAFDATSDPAASDEWVRLSMLDLVRHAWERTPTIALPHGQTPVDEPQTSSVRKVLDPNEGARWAVGVALLILLMYSVLAGPVNFYLASRKGRPLRALWHLPIYALTTLFLIVGLGALAKGLVGRARHLTLIESGAGMSRAAATRFRGFYASSAEELVVQGSERGSVLDVAGDPEETGRNIVVDRDGVRLESMRAKPWQTVVVREDGFTDIGGGISLVNKGGDVAIVNRTARDLLAVIVKPPGGKAATYFPRIADGETKLASTGTPMSKVVGRSRIGGGGVRSHRLDAQQFGDDVEPHASGITAAWQALEDVAGSETDWWPEDVPVLIAQVEGGEGRTSDSGLRVDIDRVLLRVVGFGGVP